MYLTSVFAEWLMAIFFIVFMVTFYSDLKILGSTDLSTTTMTKAEASTSKDGREPSSETFHCIVTENNNVKQC